MKYTEFLRGTLPYRDDMPNHDTLGDVLAAVDAELFKVCIADWVTSLQSSDPDIISIDGRSSRRTHACDKEFLQAEDAAKIAAYIRSEVDAGRRKFSDFLILTRKKRQRE